MTTVHTINEMLGFLLVFRSKQQCEFKCGKRTQRGDTAQKMILPRSARLEGDFEQERAPPACFARENQNASRAGQTHLLLLSFARDLRRDEARGLLAPRSTTPQSQRSKHYTTKTENLFCLLGTENSANRRLWNDCACPLSCA